jgi:organic radical activating enzyme
MENIDKATAFAKQHKIDDILLVGGEPTLHPDIKLIASKFKGQGFRVIMTTNYSMPDVVKALDGVVDCFNISFYNQPELPRQSDYTSDITLHALIYKGRLDSKESIDAFIDNYQEYGHIKFSTLVACSPWAKKNQIGSFLDNMGLDTFTLFGEILGHEYRGAIIKRHDRIINNSAEQSVKLHVDGSFSHSWELP